MGRITLVTGTFREGVASCHRRGAVRSASPVDGESRAPFKTRDDRQTIDRITLPTPATTAIDAARERIPASNPYRTANAAESARTRTPVA
ncbi:hypothetical protein [Burkholderia sp. Ac-20344]|uniref:hypothetical protein n=1 Tax=Burkholderia sp. Ac-20344 TaxID=2703890 RepID=UPI00197BCD4A|nr:hypothetical protein [Burkholderia sp. Ac-20344]MBN3834397.1 hypothetical protein [Burkholderia sp. Ac-20344]